VVANAVGKDPLRRQRNNVVGKELECEETLPARHHDQWGPVEPAADDAHSFPRILPQIAHADIEHGAADEIDGFEAGAIEPRRNISHHRSRHARRPQALVRVAQRNVDESYGSPAVHQCTAVRNSFSTQRV
jgi:hypothetical protein